MGRFVTYYRGGSGDVIERYLAPGKDAGYWKALHEDGHEVHVSISANNTSTVELLNINPHITSIHHSDSPDFNTVWETHTAEHGLIRLNHSPIINQYRWERPAVYLTEEEEIQLSYLPKPYVVVHPFAGEDFRNWSYGNVPTKDLMSWVVDHGWSVILLGGSSDRTNKEGKVHLDETFNEQTAGVVNLVGKASFRAQMRVAMGASLYIGTNSCFLSAANILGIRSFVITSPRLRPHFEYATFSIYKNFRANKNQYLLFNELEKIDLRQFVQHWLDGDTHWDWDNAESEFDDY